MEFLEPNRLWLLLAVAGFLLVYIVMQFRRRGYAMRFTNVELLDKVAPRRPGWRRHVPAVLFLAGSAVGVLAFAEPARSEDVPQERATIIMAIDTSLSIRADDVRPTRIDSAKEAAISFLDDLPERINVGLVSFNGTAIVRVPPTTNREVVKAAVDRLELDEATAIGEAIFASLDAIAGILPDETGALPPARVVLMSDGETTVGRADELAIEAAQEAAVPVSTIAFGTDRGVITLDEDPTLIPVPVNELALEAIAEGTGGQFFEAASTDELRAVYDDIGSAVGFQQEVRPITAEFVGVALALFGAAACLSLIWFSRLP